MKIINVHKYYYQKAGAERYVFDVAKLLQEHGHEVIPFAMHHSQNEQTPWSRYFVSNIDFLHPSFFEKMCIPFRMIYSLEAKRKFKALVRAVKPDIVHIHNIYHHISPSILDVCREYDIPVVQTIHDYKMICSNYMLFANGKINEDCKKGRCWRDVLNKSVKHSYIKSILAVLEMYIHHAWLNIYEKNIRMFVMPSQFSLEKFAEFGVPKEKMIHLPYPISACHPEQSEEFRCYQKKALGFFGPPAGGCPQNDTPRILAYGRLSEEKGFDVLIRAMKHIPAHLDIIGDGSMRKHLEACIQKEGVQKKVTLHGFLPRKYIFDYIKRSACVVVPSLWYEILPYTILESYALGKTVIVSNIGGMKELIEPVNPAYLFTVGDSFDCTRAITQALMNPEVCITSGEKGKMLIKELCNPQTHIQKLLDIYKSLLVKRVAPLDSIPKRA